MLKTENEIINQEAIEYLTNLIQNVKTSHSYKRYQQPIVRTKLSQSDKIKFALDYYDVFKNTSLITVLEEYGPQNPELKSLTIEFMTRYKLLIPYPDTRYEYVRNDNHVNQSDLTEFRGKHLSISGAIREYNHDNWLELFDENSIFKETKTKHPTYHFCLNKAGVPIKFDKERATKVKLAIINQGIVPARCIVEGGYPYDAKENLNEYFHYIKTLRR